jgi:hypothetical protein
VANRASGVGTGEKVLVSGQTSFDFGKRFNEPAMIGSMPGDSSPPHRHRE